MCMSNKQEGYQTKSTESFTDTVKRNNFNQKIFQYKTVKTETATGDE